jgi:hypothetical protein
MKIFLSFAETSGALMIRMVRIQRPEMKRNTRIFLELDKDFSVSALSFSMSISIYCCDFYKSLLKRYGRMSWEVMVDGYVEVWVGLTGEIMVGNVNEEIRIMEFLWSFY